MCNTSPISEATLETIIGNFSEFIDEYEIINLEKLQGWSSKHLYLIVSSDENYILKAKSSEQLAGYDNEVKVCSALLARGVPTRRPVLTMNNQIFHKDGDLYWCLMSYIPGTSSHVDEYTEVTVKTLAEHLDQYFVASLNDKDLLNLELTLATKPEPIDVLERFVSEIPILQSFGVIKGNDIEELYSSIKLGYAKYLDQSKLKSLIHNDINPRNILIDHKDRDVISLIDWDHVCYGDPLKDISDAVAIFYDYMPYEQANAYSRVFYASFTSEWFSKLENNVINYAFLYYYTVAKWQAVLFYLDLLKKYDNTYGERNRFIGEMKETYQKWSNIIVQYSSLI